MSEKDDFNSHGAEVAVEELGEVGSINSDDALLMSMGKAPQLKRVYNFWTCMWSAQFGEVGADTTSQYWLTKL